MKKIIYIVIFTFILSLTPYSKVYAISDGDTSYHADQIFLHQYEINNSNEDTENNLEAEGADADVRKVFDSLPEGSTEDFDKEDITRTKKAKVSADERPLLKRMIERNLIRTDIASYLLENELTFTPKKGPVEKVQFIGAYSGRISGFWQSGDYETDYRNNFIQIGAMGRLRNTKTDFKVIINPQSASGRNYMQNFIADAFITNNSIPHHKIIIGYSRNQVGKEGGSSSYILPFIMRSQIARNFGSTRALGVRLVGNYDLIDYSLAFNSSDRYFRKWFAGPEFTGWIDLKPLGKTDGKYGKLVIGGGLNAGKNETHYTVGSVYVGYKYKKLWTRFEYGIADGYNGSNVVDKKAQGFYGIIGYKVTPKLQLIARYDQFDPDRNVSNDLKREYTAGINWFIKGQALRLILNYVFCQNQNAPNSHRIMVGTQILL